MSTETAAPSLGEIFAGERRRPWLFVRPGGNWGDHMIWAGAEYLAAGIGLRWKTFHAEDFPSASASSDHCIFVHGGGGYNTWGSGRAFACLAQAASRGVHLVVQGPQTIESGAEALRGRIAGALARRSSRRVVFLAREPTSLGFLRAFGLPGVDIGLDRDTAFHLDARELLRLASLPRLPEGRYALTACREDDERPETSAGTEPRGAVLDPAYVAESFQHWLRIHLYAKSLITDRLHSCVVASIAGKPATLAPCAYHKNRSIWTYTLSQRGIAWTEGIRRRESVWRLMPARVRESTKVRLCRMALHGVPLH